MSNEVYRPGRGYWKEVSSLDRALFERFPKTKLEPDDSDDSLDKWIESSAQVWRQGDGLYRWISHRLKYGMGPMLSIVDGIFPASDDEQFTGRYQIRTAHYVPTGLAMMLRRTHGLGAQRLKATTSYIDHMGLDLAAMDTDSINQYFVHRTEKPLEAYFTQGPEVPAIGQSTYEFVLGALRYAYANVFPKNEC